MIWFFLSKDLLLVDRVILIYDFFLQIIGLYIDEGSAFVCFWFLFWGFFFTLSLYLQFFEIFYNPVASINYHGVLKLEKSRVL